MNSKILKIIFSFCLVIYSIDADSSVNITNCEYVSATRYLQCNSTVGSERCEVKFEGVAKEFKQFAIGELKSIGGVNPLMWFRLHPKKEDNSGWWYYKNIIDLNAKYSIHSNGKNSPNEKGFVVLDNICWSRMAVIIKQTNAYETIKTENFHFRASLKINKVNFHKIKMIGLLTIV